MIVTVTPNPAIDMTWRVSRIEPGESHRVDAGSSRAGGKGINVSRVLTQQGIDTLAIATAGGAAGAEFSADLRASRIPHRLALVAAPTRRSIALYDEAADAASIFNERGTNPDPHEWAELIDTVASALHNADCLVASGSLPPGAPADVYPRLVALARDLGVPAIVDTSGPAIVAAARAGAAVLKPNRAELLEATGNPDTLAAARGLITDGAGLVLLSLGAAGLVAVTADDAVAARLPAPLAGNPTGAGDAAVAAAASAIAEGITDTEAILRRAAAWSAAAVLMPLAGEISPAHSELAEQIVLTRDLAALLSPTTLEG